MSSATGNYKEVEVMKYFYVYREKSKKRAVSQGLSIMQNGVSGNTLRSCVPNPVFKFSKPPYEYVSGPFPTQYTRRLVG